MDNRNSEGAGSDTRDMIVDGGDAMKDERTEEVQVRLVMYAIASDDKLWMSAV